ncbi:YraN family protein [Xinfangfangia sp. CPCC 101601]|uniref:YraN family protein n=1 Tax=Pseudogemmobacter lacusdianii TaxID=3069608 RepID=A0ABU0W034_9RHOB|nr:YraN family protein [Xinfangfangia sp. CPCC 101601]MDQ2067356.1 YraN family protein [Xinfangfangia sp. CPCC 101601]
MPFDFGFGLDSVTPRQHRGRMAQLSGLAAEDVVLRSYEAQGYHLVARRKRGPVAEIDLLLRQGAQLIAVEVKSSRTHDAAMALARPGQLHRVAMACEGCMYDMAADGISDMRLDLALVDGQGRVEVMQSVLYY